MMTRDYWENRRACQRAHKFSMETIRKRRAALEEKLHRNETMENRPKGKYLDFLDILLEAKVSRRIFCASCVTTVLPSVCVCVCVCVCACVCACACAYVCVLSG